MILHWHTLATADDMRFLILLIGGAIAVFHGLAKSIAKKSSEQKKIREQLLRTRQAIKAPPNVIRRPVPVIPQQRTRTPSVPMARKVKTQVRVPLAQTARLQPPPAQPRPMNQAQPVSSALSKPLVSANSLALQKWLRPETLRQQFILTEIFQKPLALREQVL